MKLHIVGDGSFGTFLKELLKDHFEFAPDAQAVILAVPFSAYSEVSKKYAGHYQINVCSVQAPTTTICLENTNKVTSIHPLFGARTPIEHRHSILTYSSFNEYDAQQMDFLTEFSLVSRIYTIDNLGEDITPESHDRLMAATHLATLGVLEKIQPIVSAASMIPDHLIPHSFRLVRQLSKTLRDMPVGTLESIKANPYAQISDSP